MNKRITSIVLCLALLVSLMVAAVPVSAAEAVTFTMTADKTEAAVGDTITYTISIGAVENVGGFLFELKIPEGLTFVNGSSSVNPALKGSLDFGEASFAESTLVFVAASNESSTFAAETEVMSFQCTVNEGAAGALAIDFLFAPGEVFDAEYNDFDVNATGASVTIGGAVTPPPAASGVEFTVKADKAAAVAGDTITFEVYSSAVSNLGGFLFELDLPAGLTFVAGSSAVNPALKGSLNFGEASFAESTLVFVAASNESSNVPADTLVMSFQCTVNDGAEGNQTVGLIFAAGDVFDADYNDLTVTVNKAVVAIEAAVCAHDWADADCDTPKTCKLCGETEGAALGHSWAEATCTAPKTCTVCGATDGSAMGHSYEAVVTAPDCVNGGYTTYTCSVCGDSYVADETAALGHDWEAADCNTAKTCKVCGATDGSAMGHSYEAVVTAPDCVNGGYTTYTCSVCGDSYVADETAALGHDWEDADCDTAKTCKVCGATEGEALGHSWTEATCFDPKTCEICLETEGDPLEHDWFDATCTDAKTCSLCGTTEGEALGHDWFDATCTDAKTCATCGATEGTALGHSWAEATCTAPKTCTVCGYSEGTAGHDWAEATCTAPKTCKVCGETEGEALGHSYEAVVTAPDCVNGGYTTYTCSVCGDSYVADETAALGHDWADADCQNPKTCTVCGATEGEKGDHVDANNDGKCDVCGYEETPATGDESVMGFAIVLMIALACGTALVCGKKKFIA